MKNAEMNMKLDEVLPLFSVRMQQKILYSVGLLRKAERLAMAYDRENGYFLAFSGGKDSQCLYHVAKLAGVKFRAHMNLTSVDPPEVIRFVKKQYPDVDLVKPKDSIYNIAIQRKLLPTMRVRWCCEDFKETAGAGKVTLIGIRHSESSRRAKRNEVEINNHSFSGDLEGLEEYRKEKTAKANRSKKIKENKQVTIVNADGERTLGCIHGKESLLISPIIHWTEEDVWTFLNTLGIAHCELYDQGFHRIGCVLCPMSQLRQKRKEIERWPHVKRNWIKAIKAIRNGGGYQQANLSPMRGGGQPFKDGYIWWNIRADMVPCRNVRGVLRTSTCHEKTVKEELAGFSPSSSSDCLTEEQENEIAENIFDWWISGKSYKRWYAEKFLQTKLDFEDADAFDEK